MPAPAAPDADRPARIVALVERLRPAADEALTRTAEQLVDRPDAELFGEVEYRLRDAARDLAAAAHAAGRDARKKGGTTAPPSPAPAAGGAPASAAGGLAGS